MNDPHLPPIEHFVAHRGAMSLLSRLVAVDADHALAEVDVGPCSAFARDDGVPAWVGIEYMAQAVAAWAGAQARAAGREPAVGYLLGSRRYSARQAVFVHGRTLRIGVRRELIADNGLGQFACDIRDPSGACIAEAMVSVYEPPASNKGEAG